MSAPDENSITHWLGQLQDGDRDAAQQLWERYFRRLVGLARKKLRGRRLPLADEEDVALSAFDSFCRGAQAGRFPLIGDRDDLWRLLVVMTARKAHHAVRDEGRLKRGGQAAIKGLGEPRLGDDAELREIEAIVGREPDPEFAAQVAEECQRLLASLGDETLEQIAVWRMEGYSNDEIAVKRGCAPRTIERKLRLIRGVWERQQPT